MIKDMERLKQNFEQLERMYRAVLSFYTTVSHDYKDKFLLLAEGPLDEIYRLCHEIQLLCKSLSARSVDMIRLSDDRTE